MISFMREKSPNGYGYQKGRHFRIVLRTGILFQNLFLTFVASCKHKDCLVHNFDRSNCHLSTFLRIPDLKETFIR